MKKILILLLSFSLIISACGDSSEETKEADIKDSQYCKQYIEFDSGVAVMEYREQLEALRALSQTRDFPTELQEPYDTLINSYEEYFAGKEIAQDEEQNLEAYQDIARHARDNCGLYEKNQ